MSFERLFNFGGGAHTVEGPQLSCSHNCPPPLLGVFCTSCCLRSCIFARSSSVISGTRVTVMSMGSETPTAAFTTWRIGVCDRVLTILCAKECFNPGPRTNSPPNCAISPLFSKKGMPCRKAFKTTLAIPVNGPWRTYEPRDDSGPPSVVRLVIPKAA